jgi:starch synthase
VRETGGLADSVHEAGDTQNGFTFREYDAQSLVDAVARAVDAFGDERRWGEIVARGMRGDFSWDRAALQYVATYRRAIEANRVREVNIAGSGPALRMGE